MRRTSQVRLISTGLLIFALLFPTLHAAFMLLVFTGCRRVYPIILLHSFTSKGGWMIRSAKHTDKPRKNKLCAIPGCYWLLKKTKGGAL